MRGIVTKNGIFSLKWIYYSPKGYALDYEECPYFGIISSYIILRDKCIEGWNI